MYRKEPGQVDGRDFRESGPIAIGEIMPAVLARYGLAWDQPWEEVPPAVEVGPGALVLVEA